MGLVRIQMSSKYKIYTRFLRLSTKKVRLAHQNFYIDCMMKWQYLKDTGLHINIKINFTCFFLVCYVATGKCVTYTCASHSIPAGSADLHQFLESVDRSCVANWNTWVGLLIPVFLVYHLLQVAYLYLDSASSPPASYTACVSCLLWNFMCSWKHFEMCGPGRKEL